MAFCINCGNQIAPGASFCGNCGTKVGGVVPTQTPPIPQVQPSTQRQQEYIGKIFKCPNCGEVISQSAARCPSCGYEISGKAKVHSLVLPAALSSKPEYKNFGKFAYGEVELEVEFHRLV